MRPQIRPQIQRRKFSTIRTILALVLREMTTTYGKSPGGYLWAVLEPVGGIVLMSVVFSLILRQPSLGTNFPIFYATGFLPFTMYMIISRKVADSIKFSKPLLKYPSVSYMDAILARFILNLLVHIMVFYVVMVGIQLVFETHTILHAPSVVRALMMAALLGLAVGCMNCFLYSMFPVWIHVWTILNRPMFIISTIFFTLEDVPGPYRNLLSYNPLVHIVGEMRRGFYPTYDAVYVSYTYVVGISMVMLAAGLGLLSLYYRIILNR